MTLQKSVRVNKETFDAWNNNKTINKLLIHYSKVLMLPMNERRYSFSHIECELSTFFALESAKARDEVESIRRELQATPSHEETRIKQIKSQLNSVLARIDDMTLGLEHFYREFSKLSQLASVDRSNQELANGLTKLAKSYGEMFIDGQSIELLNGDSGEISTAWFTIICNQLIQKNPHLRVFVISIIGLLYNFTFVLFYKFFLVLNIGYFIF
jgi:hypothetical protein